MRTRIDPQAKGADVSVDHIETVVGPLLPEAATAAPSVSAVEYVTFLDAGPAELVRRGRALRGVATLLHGKKAGQHPSGAGPLP